MKDGDYVIVNDHRGSFSATVLTVTEDFVRVVCKCCFAPIVCKKEHVTIPSVPEGINPATGFPS